MYQRSERPMSDVEREQLDARLREVKEALGTSMLLVALLVPLDGLFVFAAVMAALGRDRSGTVGIVAGMLAGLFANVVLVWSVVAFVSERRHRSRLREAKVDGVAVVEHVEATAAVTVREGRRVWHLLAVAEGRLLAVPDRLLPWWPPGLPACFELVTARAHGLFLSLLERGRSWVVLSSPVDLAALVREPEPRQRLTEMLDRRALIAGDADHLGDGLQRLLAEGQGVDIPPAPAGVNLREIQAAVEERFGINFGPGGLAAVLERLGEPQQGAPTAGDLLRVVRAWLPRRGRCVLRPVRPTFYRLRAALAAECGVPRRCIRPSALLEDLVPRPRRADRWSGLARRLEQELPTFAEHDPPVLALLVGAAGMALLYGVGVPAVQAVDAWAQAGRFGTAWWFLIAGMCFVPTFFVMGMALSFALGMHLFRNRAALRFRADCATVADLTQQLVAQSGREVAEPWTEETTWQALRLILARALHRRPFEVTPETVLVARGLH
jgi:hypothetical protein